MTNDDASANRMKLLLCCEFYHPSRGGVQEVMRQLAERFASAGHDVTVATSFLPQRDFQELNGVKIAEFHVGGNYVRGLDGEVERYRDFLRAFDGDAILIKAAQQWTFDACWPALKDLTCRKVFIPCGFSALYEPDYSEYFEKLPDVLKLFDRLIFYAEDYRDVNFARRHGLGNLSFLPNGASEAEFGVPALSDIRKRLGIADDALLAITVGTPTSMKGHLEVAEAFARLDPRGRRLALVLNGQWGARPAEALDPDDPDADPLSEAGRATQSTSAAQGQGRSGARAVVHRAIITFQRGGLLPFLRRLGRWLYHRTLWLMLMPLRPMVRPIRRAISRVRAIFYRAFLPNTPLPPPKRTIDDVITEIGRDPFKIVLQTELPRNEVVELFFAADLFVFASKVEYSPLVLFEACASGLPFISVPAGNAAEIARWTGGGVICPAEKDEQGYLKVDPVLLAERMDYLLSNEFERTELGTKGRRAWLEHFSWGKISERYLAILSGRASTDATSDTIV